MSEPEWDIFWMKQKKEIGKYTGQNCLNPKNNFVSTGGGKSYLFSEPALPCALANSEIKPSLCFHVCCLSKPFFDRNLHFLYKVSIGRGFAGNNQRL